MGESGWGDNCFFESGSVLVTKRLWRYILSLSALENTFLLLLIRTYGSDLSTGGKSVCYEPYTTFDERYRRENVGNKGKCDKYKVDGTCWYRFQLLTGEKSVLDHCPRWFTCGTGLAICMDSTLPEQHGVINTVIMYASTMEESGSGNNCFSTSGSVLVTKC